MKNNPDNKNLGAIGIIAILAAVLVLIGGGFFAYQYLQLQKVQEATKPPSSESTTPPPASTEIDTSDWKTYRNEEYGFEVKYPEIINFTGGREITTTSEGKVALFTFWPSEGVTRWSYWQGKPTSASGNHGGPATYFEISVRQKQLNEDLSCHGRVENLIIVGGEKVVKCILPGNYFGAGDSLSLKIIRGASAFSFYSDFYDENYQNVDSIITSFKFIK